MAYCTISVYKFLLIIVVLLLKRTWKLQCIKSRHVTSKLTVLTIFSIIEPYFISFQLTDFQLCIICFRYCNRSLRTSFTRPMQARSLSHLYRLWPKSWLTLSILSLRKSNCGHRKSKRCGQNWKMWLREDERYEIITSVENPRIHWKVWLFWIGCLPCYFLPNLLPVYYWMNWWICDSLLTSILTLLPVLSLLFILTTVHSHLHQFTFEIWIFIPKICHIVT